MAIRIRIVTLIAAYFDGFPEGSDVNERSFAVEVTTSPLWHMPIPERRESSITSEPFAGRR
jgi:hypothetical protein